MATSRWVKRARWLTINERVGLFLFAICLTNTQCQNQRIDISPQNKSFVTVAITIVSEDDVIRRPRWVGGGWCVFSTHPGDRSPLQWLSGGGREKCFQSEREKNTEAMMRRRCLRVWCNMSVSVTVWTQDCKAWCVRSCECVSFSNTHYKQTSQTASHSQEAIIGVCTCVYVHE